MMSNYTIKYKKYAILVMCTLISIFITYLFSKDRMIGYDIVPNNAIFDEHNYVLQALGIRDTGIPIGWSDSGDYINMPDTVVTTELNGFNINVNQIKPNWLSFRNFPQPVISINEFDFGLGMQHLKFVQPFIDHSPIGGLFYSTAINGNVKEFLDIRSVEYRKPALALAVTTSFLLFIFAYLVFNNPFISVLSTIVYNSVPTYLFATRYALLENVVAPLILLMLNLLLLSIKFNKFRISIYLTAIAGIISGLAVLTKESAIGFLLSGLILLLVYKVDLKKIAVYIIASLLPIIIYIIWGYYLFSDLFIKIFIFNSSRSFLGSLNFVNTFFSIGFKNFYLDGWWVLGFISFIFLYYFDKRKSLPITVPFVCGLFTILFFAGQNYLWYYLALIPFLALSTAYLIWRIIVKPDPISLVVFFLFAISSSLYWGHEISKLPANAWEYRGLMLLYTSIGLLRIFKPKNKWVVFTWITLLVLVVAILTKWNHNSILYIVSNWQTLEVPNFPKF